MQEGPGLCGLWPGASRLRRRASSAGKIIHQGQTLNQIAVPVFRCPFNPDQLREALHIRPIQVTDRMNKAVQPLKWLWIILFLGFVFVGGDFCDICPNKVFSTCVPYISVAAQFKELERLPFKTSYGKIFVKVNKTRSRPEIIIIYGGLFKSYFSATGPISANEIRGFPFLSKI